MTLLFADGFEDGTMAWTLTNSMVAGAGRYGGGLVAGGSVSGADFGFGATAGPIIVGFAVKPMGTGAIGLLYDGANAFHAGLVRGSGGEITVQRRSTVLGTSAADVLPLGAWSYVEMKLTVHDTTGAVAVRVNGVQVINLTNVDTRDGTPTTASTLRLGYGLTGGGATVTDNAYDDVYICDANGTVNNDFLGELTVEHLRPGGTDTAQWLGSDGDSTANFALVDEPGVYDGTDYVGSSTVGQRDLYIPVASSRLGTTPVYGVVVAAVAMKSDAGARTVTLDAKEGSGGTVRTSAAVGLPTSFGELRAVFERKGDGSQFTVADVNALRVGIEVAT